MENLSSSVSFPSPDLEVILPSLVKYALGFGSPGTDRNSKHFSTLESHVLLKIPLTEVPFSQKGLIRILELPPSVVPINCFLGIFLPLYLEFCRLVRKSQ